jgi:NAD(P)-dependent dehydrogenase (short-subunit alcohol dehydrogenase family)
VTTIQGVAGAAVEDDEWVLDVNLHGVVHGTRAFLPLLLRQDSGVIVNTSSVFGLLGMPYQSAYCASKFAVRGFTDSLRAELRDTGVRAVNVHPGGIRTPIARNARFHNARLGENLTHEQTAERFERVARTTPEKAAKIIHEGVKAGKSRILVGPDAYVFDALARLAPSRYYDVIAALEPLTRRS